MEHLVRFLSKRTFERATDRRRFEDASIHENPFTSVHLLENKGTPSERKRENSEGKEEEKFFSKHNSI